ncbi:MAG: glycosyl hydrolase 115 family protein [Prolixibacteraceae bacterium]|nr:glycosyl hydrolase 115 family protein [Prolixibacteraceae bacterium]
MKKNGLKKFALVLFIVTGMQTLCNAVVIDTASYVSETKHEGYFPLCNNNGATPFLTSSTEYAGVNRALTDLQNDVFKITGETPDLFEDVIPGAKNLVIAGTLNKNLIIDSLVANHVIDTTGLTGKWEKFIIQTVANPFSAVDSALVIVGSDKRGTIFGIYDVSEQIGISPWHFWADVPAKEKEAIFIKPGKHTRGEPAVKYRGIFLNDEAPALSGWVSKTYGFFNHQFYEEVFELILRLKGNFLWPAMWGKSFFEDDELNPILADEYGIVISTSHHEPMLRAQKDWSTHGKGDWNYETNADELKEFWREGIVRNEEKESIVTIGMRGDGDEPMTTGTAIELLERIVADQRTIISNVTGEAPEKTPQVWALYKEVQDYYDQGMDVPDDVTLLFADDNWGNIRRLPAPGAPEREGGYGIYYHFDYVGGPRSYKWLNTNPLPRIWEQMNLAYQHGVETIWIVNVGDLKPMEFPASFFLDMAWNPEFWTAERMEAYHRLWTQQQFGENHAPAIGSFLARYGKYNGRRKPELLNEQTYSLVNFREAESVLGDYKQLEHEVDSVAAILPGKLQDAYFQLVEHPVDACANLHDMYFNLGKNYMYSFQGRTSTNDYGEKVKELFDKDAEITRYYHTQVADGKWDRMMSQPHIGYTSWSDPSTNIEPEVYEIKVPGSAQMGVAVEGFEGYWPVIDTLMLNFNAFRQSERYIEIFNKGKTPFEYSVAVDTAILKITPNSGRISQEQRLNVSVNWTNTATGTDTIPVTIHGPNEQTATVYVRVFNPEITAPDDTECFFENDGYIAMEAHHFHSMTETEQNRWQIIPDFGRTGSGVTTMPTTSASVSPGGNSPHLSYSVYFFTSGTVKVNAYLAPTINYLARPEGLRYAVSLNDNNPVITSFNGDTDAGRANNIIISSTNLEVTEAGLHSLKYWMVDPGVVLQKIVVETGPSKNSYLGPPEKPYTNQNKMFITAAKLHPDDSRKVEIVFSEMVEISTLEMDDFTILNNDTVNPVTNIETVDDYTIIFTLTENSTAKQRVTLSYTPGSTTSMTNSPLTETRNYILQYGEAKEAEQVDDPNIYFEAESGIIGSNWDLHIDGFSSGAAYIMTKPGIEKLDNASADAINIVTYTFKICKDDNYTLWARVFAPSPNDDSFWIKMDNGNWTMWNNIRGGNNWSWDYINQDYYLDTGYHTLTICMREDGTGLDKLCLSNTGTAPTGTGGFYEECEITSNMDPVMKKTRKAVVYPNPVKNRLIVKTYKKYEHVIIKNIRGENISIEKPVKPNCDNTLNTNYLKPGIYFLVLSSNEAKFYEAHKFVKK